MPAIAPLLPYPVHSLYLVARDSAAGDSVPVRLEPPVLSDGPHLSYAIQWFAFAAIALVGAAAVIRRERNTERAGAQLAEGKHRSE
jgi:cytochrome oxidase assembly protein ShyY1